MKVLFCALFSAMLLHAINLDDIHITQGENAVEIDLILDSAFDDSVIQRDSSEFTTLIFKNIKYNKNKVSTKTKLIDEIEIFAQDGDLYIILVKENLNLNIDINVRHSNNSLKISLNKKESLATNILANSSAQNGAGSLTNPNLASANLSTSQGIETWRYILVVFILIALLIALILIKRRAIRLNGAKFTYFNQKSLNVSQVINIDVKNKIVVLDSKNAKYMLFIGANSSFLIDKIDLNEQSDVNKMLSQRAESKLSYLLKMYDNEK